MALILLESAPHCMRFLMTEAILPIGCHPLAVASRGLTDKIKQKISVKLRPLKISTRQAVNQDLQPAPCNFK